MEIIKSKENFFILITTLMVYSFLSSGYFIHNPDGSDSGLRNLINKENLDTTISPNDNFYRYANGNWLKNNPIPPEFNRWGSFQMLYDQNSRVLKEILEEAANSNAPKGSNMQKIGDLYYTAMDTNAIDALGTKPIEDILEKINSIKSKEDLVKVIAYYHTLRIQNLFGMYAGQDDKNSSIVIAQFYQSGIGLPERDYYLKEDDKSAELRNKYVDYIKQMFTLINDGSADANSKTVMDIETRLAKAHMTNIEQRNPDAVYNKMTLDELVKLTPDFDWRLFFKETGIDEAKLVDGINIAQPKYMQEIDAMLNEVSLNDWKVYLRWCLLNDAAGLLGSKFEDANYDFYGKTLSGSRQKQPRWRTVLNYVNGSLGEALGQLFVEKMFSPEAKERAIEMVRNILAAMRDRITNLAWMSEQTKQMALKKLDGFGVKIGYPDKWRDYTELEINRSSLYENMIRAAQFGFKRMINKLGKAPDLQEWGMLPHYVNAYYSASKNEIVFPAGILQPPFFDPEADDAVNYGGVGGIIGHEITHGFDDGGAKYDVEGNLKNWWSKEDEEKFNALTGKLVLQAGNFAPIDTFKANGKLTLGENIADLGGVTIAYYALMKAIDGKNVKPIDGFTPQQRFFLSWAQIWRINMTPEITKLFLNTDVHGPNEFRVNGPLSNMPDFQQAFKGKEGDPMVRNNESRIVIW
ncbi:MAG: M13 family peptidase [Ignavibacteriae bacterium]|nr:MAG: M13 family peptidase [Ignavibacteriota bacterium]